MGVLRHAADEEADDGVDSDDFEVLAAFFKDFTD